MLQVFGDGPVKLAVAEVQPDLASAPPPRWWARCRPARGWRRCSTCTARAAARSRSTRKDRLPGQQPYQGVVPLHGDQREPLQQLSQVLEHYMLQSEQLDTRLVLAADDQVAAGLLIQRLPVEGRGQPGRRERATRTRSACNEDFNRIAHAGRHADARRTADAGRRHAAAPPVLGGDAAPLRAAAAALCLQLLARTRARHAARPGRATRCDSIIAERGLVEVGCEFCGLQYRFDAVDVGEMFTPRRDQPPQPGAAAVSRAAQRQPRARVRAAWRSQSGVAAALAHPVPARRLRRARRPARRWQQRARSAAASRARPLAADHRIAQAHAACQRSCAAARPPARAPAGRRAAGHRPPRAGPARSAASASQRRCSASAPCVRGCGRRTRMSL